MIICNPNMGYAECQQYSSEWNDFYLNFGINVVLWNYRGYGKSTGAPSPGANRKDVELVYQWARAKTLEAAQGLKEVKIGVHGISIGGLTAARLGRLGLVDFLFMDRCFSNLQEIPRQVNRCLPPFLQLVTMWQNPDNANDYIYSNCYKVIT